MRLIAEVITISHAIFIAIDLQLYKIYKITGVSIHFFAIQCK